MNTENSKDLIWVIGFILLLVVAIATSILIYRNLLGINVQEEPFVEEVVLEEAEVIEEEIPKNEEVNKEAYDITVLNGSGIAGDASRVQGLLEEEGFIVTLISNADRSDYDKTSIQAGEEVSIDFLEELSGFLSESYGAILTTTLQDDDSSVVITLGSVSRL